MQNKNIAIYILILIVGLLIGAAVATRHYGVGPLAKLKGNESSADGAGDLCIYMGEVGPTYTPCRRCINNGGVWAFSTCLYQKPGVGVEGEDEIIMLEQ